MWVIYYRNDIMIISSFTLDSRKDTVVTSQFPPFVLFQYGYPVVFRDNEHLWGVNKNA